MLFRQIIFYSLLVGFAAGLVVSIVQSFQVVPIIIGAEQFETGDPAVALSAHNVDTHAGHSHGHSHDGEAWAPHDGLERTGFTVLSNVLTAIGFALFTLVAMLSTIKSSNSRQLNWYFGLLWGAAGYTVFFLAPALGMPPEIPGAAASSLEGRQSWWLMTVVLTATGLAGLAFIHSAWRWSCLVLLALPHIIGAPHPEGAMFADQSVEATAQLTQLANQFIGATAIANAALWISIGLVSIWSARRIMQNLDKHQGGINSV